MNPVKLEEIVLFPEGQLAAILVKLVIEEPRLETSRPLLRSERSRCRPALSGPDRSQIMNRPRKMLSSKV